MSQFDKDGAAYNITHVSYANVIVISWAQKIKYNCSKVYLPMVIMA